jgi:hypothetical protein
MVYKNEEKNEFDTGYDEESLKLIGLQSVNHDRIVCAD